MPFSTFLTAPNMVGSESQALSVSSSSCSSASSLFERASQASDYQSDATPPGSPPVEEFLGDIGLQGSVAPNVVVQSASHRDISSLEDATPKVANAFANLLFDDDSDDDDFDFDMVQCLRERLMRGNATAASQRALEIMAGTAVSAAPSEPLMKLTLAPQVDYPAEDWSGDFDDSENPHLFLSSASASSHVVTQDIDDINFDAAFDAELQSPVEAPLKLVMQSTTYEFNDAAFELDSPIESPNPVVRNMTGTGASPGLTSSASMNARVGLGLLGVALSIDVTSIDDTFPLLPNPHGEAPEKQYSLESPSPLSLSSPIFTVHGTLTATIRLSPSMLSPKPRPLSMMPVTFSNMSPKLSLPTPRSLTVTTSSISLIDGSHFAGNLTDSLADSIFSPAHFQSPVTNFAALCTLEPGRPVAATKRLGGGVGLGLPSRLANRAPRGRDVISRPLVSHVPSPDDLDMAPLRESLSQALMERLVTPARDYLRIQHFPKRMLYSIEEVKSPLCASPSRMITGAPSAFRSRIPKPTRVAATFGCGIAASTRLSPPKSSHPLSLIPRLNPLKLKPKLANPSRSNLRNKKVFPTPSRIPRYVPSAARSLRARAPSRIPRLLSLASR